MTIGHPIITFDTLESTNKTAAELLSLSKVQHGAVILAREQTSGLGQRGRSWISKAGADLMMSVVLKPPVLRAEDQFILSKVVSLAVRDVAERITGSDVRIKWPNDILVDRRKLAGILIKNDVVGDLVTSSVVGVGINANSSEFPEELVATSLFNETGRLMDLGELLTGVCAALNHWWGCWQEDPAGLDSHYCERLWARGRWAEVVLDGASTQARPMDVDRHGRLIVELEGGKVAAYGLDRLRFAAR